MGMFSRFKKKVQAMDDQSLVNLSRSTRLKRDTANVGSAVAVVAALPSGGISLFQTVYTGPRGWWYGKKNRIANQILGCRGLPIPARTKRDYIIPATVGLVAGSLGAGADAVAGSLGGAVPDAMHAIPIDEWVSQAGQAGLETTGNHVATIANPEFVGELTGDAYHDAYEPDYLAEHARNGMQHLAETASTILPGGAPLLSQQTANIAGQTVAAVAIGELAGKVIEETAPRRRSVKY